MAERIHLSLHDSVERLPGIGPKRKALLARLGVATIHDLLWHLPRSYVAVSEWSGAAGDARRVRGTVRAVRPGPKDGVAVLLETAHGPVRALFFHKPYLRRTLRPGQPLVLVGRVEAGRPPVLVEPRRLAAAWQDAPVLPVYPATADLPSERIADLVQTALRHLPGDGVPAPFRAVHRPRHLGEAEDARAALKALEAAAVAAAWRAAWPERPGRPFAPGGELVAALLANLPFALREEQRRAMAALAAALDRPVALRALLTGEVGSGKTLVALYAAAQVASRGGVVVFLAPTRLLAEQHLATARSLLPDAHLAAVFGERAEAVRAGSIVLATTKLRPSQGVRPDLVIVDEEQRFGVEDREGWLDHRPSPHYLALSATPIPRTLARLLLGGFLCLELREGAPRSVVTRVVPTVERERVYRFVQGLVRSGRQAAIVSPRLAEPGEDVPSARQLYAAARRWGLPVLLLHGGQDGRELAPLREGQAGLVIATQVVEVGVDLPALDAVVVEGAHHFGLAQLHQLRGRVGRRGQRGYALLVSDRDVERLRVLQAEDDGFRLAEADLRLRGPGTLAGLRQHGFPRLRALELPDDLDRLAAALATDVKA